MPEAAQAMASHTRGATRSRSSSHDSSATAPGMPAIATPAAVAEVSATPYSMQIENRKLPRKLSQNSSQRSWRDSGASPGVRRTQCSIASAAMPKRSQASRKTGNTATSSFDSPT
jgi:hypothetical protein